MHVKGERNVASLGVADRRVRPQGEHGRSRLCAMEGCLYIAGSRSYKYVRFSSIHVDIYTRACASKTPESG